MNDHSRRRERLHARAAAGLLAHAVLALCLAVYCLGLPQDAVAVSEICGDQIDNDGASGDLPCPDPDKDRDGYWTDGLGPNTGTDCDDTQRYDYPGISSQGACDSGEFRTCQSDGTYTSCAAMSTFSCSSGSGSTYFIDDDETDCAGTGAWDDEENWFCFSNTGMANYHAPVAGDCYVFFSGTYSSSWSSGTRQIYVNNKDGTSSNKIKIIAAPGHAWWETGETAGVYITAVGTYSSNVVENLEFEDTDYWEISGLEINGAAGFSNAGISWVASSNHRAYNNHVYNIRADARNLNLSGLKARAGSNNLEWDHNRAHDNYDATESTAENTSDYLHMDDDTFNVHDNISYSTISSPFAGWGIKIKHGLAAGTSGSIKRNIIYNKNWAGIGVNPVANTVVENNYLDYVNVRNSGSAIQYKDLGGAGEYKNQILRYNTIRNSPFVELVPNTDSAAIGSSFIDINHNVVSDNRASYNSDGTEGFFRACYYCDSGLYATVVTGGTIAMDYNCEHNSAAAPLYYTVWGAGAGFSSTSFVNWVAAVASLGWEAHSYSENPAFNVYGQATSTNCADKGWSLTTDFPPPTPTATPTPSPTPTPTPSIGWAVGLNFRESVPYCTDPSSPYNTVAVTGDNYPTSRNDTGGNSITFGWVDALSDGTRNRDSGVDCRLAGVNFSANSGTPRRFQLDLPATGDYTVCLALGDATSGNPDYTKIEIFDDTTAKFNVTDADGIDGGNAPAWDDATGAEFTSAAAFFAGQTCQTVTFATTTLIFKLGSTTAQSQSSSISHFYVGQEVAPTPPPSTGSTSPGTIYNFLRRRR